MKIKKTELPHYQLCHDMDVMVNKSVKLYDLVHKKLMKEILRLLRGDKLAKAEDELERGWTGEIPLIKFDIEKKMVPVIDRYLLVLMYFMLGDIAGKEAKKAAEELGFKSNIVPGGVFGAYLKAIDAQRDYYQMVYGETAPNMQKKLLEASFQVIQDKTKRTLGDSLTRYKNQMIDAVQQTFSEKNIENVVNVHEKAHELLEDGKSTAKALKAVERKINAKDLQSALSEVGESYAKSWETNSETLVSMATSSGTHQSMVEIFGAAESAIRAALVNILDDRCCDTCEQLARDAKGELKVYELGAFKPAGYNFSRKKADWVLSITPIHHRCRCSIVYIPKGFKINKDGTIYKP